MAFPATYDATGRWCCSDSNVWVNPGNAGCTADPAETSCITITQTGNNFTVVDGDQTFTGTVNGTTYSFSCGYVDGEGTDITISGQFTLSSCSSGCGSVTWSATDGPYYCNGGNDITLTKVYTQGELPYYDNGLLYIPLVLVGGATYDAVLELTECPSDPFSIYFKVKSVIPK